MTGAPTRPTGVRAVKPARLRARHGAIFLVGAATYELLFRAGEAAFWWTPLVLGFVYLAAAVTGGKDGGYWATAVVLVGWGIAVAIVNETPGGILAAPAYLIGVGAGVVAGGVLATRGFAVDAAGMGATVIAGGVLFALQAEIPDVLVRPELYAGFLALVGIWNLIQATLGDRGPVGSAA